MEANLAGLSRASWSLSVLYDMFIHCFICFLRNGDFVESLVIVDHDLLVEVDDAETYIYIAITR